MADENNNQDNQKKSTMLGQVKDAGKNGIKKVGKRLLKFLLPIVPILLIAMLFYATIALIVEFFSEIAENIADFFTLDTTGSIIITDESIDKVISTMKSELNLSPEDLNLLGDIDYDDPDQEEAIKKAERKYIKLFLEAQETTQTINDGGFLGTGLGAEGSVYIKTVNDGASDTSNLKDMQVTSMTELQNKVSRGDSNVWNYFSVNESGQLVVPIMNNGAISLTSIDYKSMITQYSTPWNFFIDLEMVVENPKFMEAFVELVKDSKINLTVLYNTTYTKETITHTYKVTETTTDPETGEEIEYTRTVVDTTVNEYENRNPTLVITTADTWVYLREASYKATTNTTVSDPVTTGTDDDKYTTVVETTTTTYSQDGVTKEEYNGGQKGEEGTFVGLLDKKFKIPNSQRRATAGESLVSGADILFDLLQRSETTQSWENIMRYILYVYTGKSYGVTEFDFSLFAINNFTIMGVNNLSGYLRQFSHSGEAPQSADGNYYLMYGDGAGWPTIGNADIQWKSHHSKFKQEGKVLQNGTEATVTDVEAYVNGLLGRGATAEYTDSEIKQKQIYVEKELVDTIGDNIMKTYYNSVSNATRGLNLSQQQMYALTAIAYNFGNLPTRNGYTFKQVYEAASAQYEVNSWQHNKFIWDNWWCYLGGGYAGHIPARDASFETYVKGVYDFTQSDAGEVFGRKYYIYYTQSQLNHFSYSPNKPVTRTSANEQEIFTYEEKSVGSEGSTQISGINISTYTSSSGRTYIQYKQNVGPWATQRYGELTISAQGCSITSIAIALSGYGYDYTPSKFSGALIGIYDTTKRYASGSTRTFTRGGDGMAYNQVQQQHKQDIVNHLNTGNAVIFHVLGAKKGYSSTYTGNQHWMVLTDVNADGTEAYVSNPYSTGPNGWNSLDIILQSLCCYIKVSE